VTRRFLFVLWEGGGNVPPALAIASRLVARGHDVRVLGDPCLEPDALAAGASFVPYRAAPHRATRTADSEIIRDWEATTPLGAFARARDRHAFRPAALFAGEVLTARSAHDSEVVIVDAMLFGGLVGAEASGRPWAALIPMTSFLPAPRRPPPAMGLAPARGLLGALRDRLLLGVGNRLLWRSCVPLLNEARRQVGLADVAHPLDQIRRATCVLVLTSPAFDWGAPAEQANVVYAGPELADPAWAAGEIVEAPAGEHPLVLVALSSTYQRQEALLDRILEALASLPVRAVVTLGPATETARFHPPLNAVVVARASHTALLREARLVVTHGGHGTVLRALASGVPMVVLPMGRDQSDNAVRVEHLGAGAALSPRSSASALRRAIERALADTRELAAARAMAETLARERRRGDVAVERLEALGGAG
jgi:UDP:flavonoid glycosyltransferase YjiC (YdhE family)